MGFRESIQETIQARRAVRSYDPKREIERDKLEELGEMMRELGGSAFRFQVTASRLPSGEKVKLSTYGMIKGAQVFLVGIMNSDSKEDVIAFGSAFEYLVLKATELGLGTCWMVGTFDMEAFASSVSLDANEKVAIVSPLGYENDPHLTERVLRSALDSDRRLDWDKLFFDNSLESPLARSDVDVRHTNVLEMVRLAPSAANSQPWRIVRSDGGKFRFYLDTEKMYRSKRHHCGYNDLGIAKAHFELAAGANGVAGEWQGEALDDLEAGRYEYLFSWIGR